MLVAIGDGDFAGNAVALDAAHEIVVRGAIIHQAGHHHLDFLAAQTRIAHQEVAPFGIRVLIVEPGAFRTEFFGRSMSKPANPIAEYASLAAMRAQLDQMLLLQVDVTANNEDDKALLKRFSLFGPPGIIFFDAEGREIKGLRVIGYQKPDRFLKTLSLATAP